MALLKNAKHEHFAQLVSNGESATRAYVLAGYSEHGAGQSAGRLLKNAEICARIAELRAMKEQQHKAAVEAVFDEAALTKGWVLRNLVRVMTMAVAAEPVLDQDGNPVGEYKTNLAAANRALELIGKERGMFVDRKEVRTGALDELPHEDMKELRDALARRLDRSQVVDARAATGRAH